MRANPGPNNVGTVSTGGIYTAFPATNLANTTTLPQSSLFVGLGSHDRNITDTSVFNQTDLITDVRDRPGPASADHRIGARPGNEQRAELLAQHPRHQFLQCRLADRSRLQLGRESDLDPRQPGASQCHRRGALHQRYDVVREILESRRRRALRQLQRQPHELDQPAPSASQNIGFTSVRAGVIYPAHRGAVVLRLVRHVVQPIARNARRWSTASKASIRKRALKSSWAGSGT